MTRLIDNAGTAASCSTYFRPKSRRANPNPPWQKTEKNLEEKTRIIARDNIERKLTGITLEGWASGRGSYPKGVSILKTKQKNNHLIHKITKSVFIMIFHWYSPVKIVCFNLSWEYYKSIKYTRMKKAY